ncbi:MAG: BsuPI-related putative proteinase inhibitor [bacterium]
MAKKILILAALISMAFGQGCENANLFDSPKSGTENNLGFGPSGETAIAMDIQGGFAGVHRNLKIKTNGYVLYVDYGDTSGHSTSMLKPDEYNALVAYFLEKDFFDLKDSYFEPNAADVFLYSITFQHGGREKTVGADDLAAPVNLRDLIARLHGIIESIEQHELELSFSMDRRTLPHGQTVELTLTATNRQPHALQLTSGVQMFEFFAIPHAAAAPRLPEEHSSTFVWNYTYGKVYIMILQTSTLAAGESLTFRATWDGRGNNGELLEGTYLVGAQMMSSPGGFTGLQTLQIVR